MARPANKTFVFMGVSGCGKSTIGGAFADAISGTFLDGDDFHPPANVAKMSAGTPLDDDDRAGWIEAIAAAIASHRDGILCIACSALKHEHREQLRRATENLAFVYLHGSRELLMQRHQERSGHFMPAALLDSQLADLEEPASALRMEISATPEEIIADLRENFSL